jgi:hypothetical protein
VSVEQAWHGWNTGTPDGGGLGFLLKLLFTAESPGNGFIFDSPMTAFLSLSHSPSHCCCRSASHSSNVFMPVSMALADGFPMRA